MEQQPGAWRAVARPALAAASVRGVAVRPAVVPGTGATPTPLPASTPTPVLAQVATPVPAPRRRDDAGTDGASRRRTLPEDAASPWREMLDHIDLGVLLVDVQGQVLAANHAGRLACSGPSAPLHLWNGVLQTAVPQDQDPLRRALHAAAHRGLRTLLRVGPAGHVRHLTLLPLRRTGAGPLAPSPVQILFDRQPTDGGLALESFAQLTGLTPAEATVLQMLCAGVRPDDIAQRGGVAISTVRTQLAAIRQKTQSGTLRELVRRIGHLPPVMPALRGLPDSRQHPRAGDPPGHD